MEENRFSFFTQNSKNSQPIFICFSDSSEIRYERQQHEDWGNGSVGEMPMGKLENSNLNLQRPRKKN